MLSESLMADVSALPSAWLHRVNHCMQTPLFAYSESNRPLCELNYVHDRRSGCSLLCGYQLSIQDPILSEKMLVLKTLSCATVSAACPFAISVPLCENPADVINYDIYLRDPCNCSFRCTRTR